MAKLTGFSKSQISEWKNGKHRPSRQSAHSIAFALRIPLVELLQEIETRERNQNHPKPPVYCITCHRKLYRIPANPAQFEAAKLSEDQTQAA